MRQQFLMSSWKTASKLVSSYFKKSWSIHDYPTEYRQISGQDTGEEQFPWEARIINWYWMSGKGHTKQEAFKALQENFIDYQAKGNDLPRPGSKSGVVFTSVEQINYLEPEGIILFKEIFGLDYYGMFISDDTTLYDFCDTKEKAQRKIAKIQEKYGIRVEDISGLRIVGILERMREAGV
ncbi:hypothetical protein QPK24_06640 [Paenibacillus polygoni]|uniref:Uncharacterized protein n=1 Tax=Paenibacillus polygoni TaxID=3050112 RepID=A0ABY8XAY8_9BACL|nr:hypothetical protein [Paenibacillus polygoni]WIV20365.1 hypothetical protein QPK24_06640 [Paenibacillus polygoni]